MLQAWKDAVFIINEIYDAKGLEGREYDDIMMTGRNEIVSEAVERCIEGVETNTETVSDITKGVRAREKKYTSWRIFADGETTWEEIASYIESLS